MIFTINKLSIKIRDEVMSWSLYDLLECVIPRDTITQIVDYFESPNEFTETRNELTTYWLYFRDWTIKQCRQRLQFIQSKIFLSNWIQEKQGRMGRHTVILSKEGKKLSSLSYGSSRRYHWNNYYQLDFQKFYTESGRLWSKNISYHLAMTYVDPVKETNTPKKASKSETYEKKETKIIDNLLVNV